MLTFDWPIGESHAIAQKTQDKLCNITMLIDHKNMDAIKSYGQKTKMSTLTLSR